MAAITINIADDLLRFLRSFAKSSGKTQKQIVEEALAKKKNEEWKLHIRENTKKFAASLHDNKEVMDDIKLISSSGMTQYADNLNSIEDAKS